MRKMIYLLLKNGPRTLPNKNEILTTYYTDYKIRKLLNTSTFSLVYLRIKMVEDI